MLAASYLAKGFVKPYTAKMRKIYGEKCRLMLDCLEKEMPEGRKLDNPGRRDFSPWVSLPEGVDSEKLFMAAIEKKVAFVTGAPFHVDGGGVQQAAPGIQQQQRGADSHRYLPSGTGGESNPVARIELITG